jgi:uncharacterized protein YecE (DUF72 family)
LLRDNDIALCISDHHDAPSPWVVTARHVYVRCHGPGGRYRGHYRRNTLEKWQRWLKGMRRSGHQCYVYFDNDQKSAAPKDASKLAELLGVQPTQQIGRRRAAERKFEDPLQQDVRSKA